MMCSSSMNPTRSKECREHQEPGSKTDVTILSPPHSNTCAAHWSSSIVAAPLYPLGQGGKGVSSVRAPSGEQLTCATREARLHEGGLHEHTSVSRDRSKPTL